jgi:hypothetical protein
VILRARLDPSASNKPGLPTWIGRILLCETWTGERVGREHEPLSRLYAAASGGLLPGAVSFPRVFAPHANYLDFANCLRLGGSAGVCWPGRLACLVILKECHKHAADCRNLAVAKAFSAAARENFTNIAESWERLARELESAQSFLEAMNEIDTADQQKPRDAISVRPSSEVLAEGIPPGDPPRKGRHCSNALAFKAASDVALSTPIRQSN